MTAPAEENRVLTHLIVGPRGTSTTASKGSLAWLLERPRASARLYVGPRGTSTTAPPQRPHQSRFAVKAPPRVAPSIREFTRNFNNSAPRKKIAHCCGTGPPPRAPTHLYVGHLNWSRSWAQLYDRPRGTSMTAPPPSPPETVARRHQSGPERCPLLKGGTCLRMTRSMSHLRGLSGATLRQVSSEDTGKALAPLFLSPH